MTDPITLAALHKAGLAQSQLVKKVLGLATANDEQHARDRLDTALSWGAELKAAAAEAVPLLAARFADLDAQIEALQSDAEAKRVYRNLGFEAAREAIDGRRRMLAHAAIGILDPDVTVERKARVERRLRELDPIDVRTLFGVSIALRAVETKGVAKLLFWDSSGDVLVAAGCVRLEATGGGGAGGVGAWTKVTITDLGLDVLGVLRSYVATRGAPFVIPGREILPGHRAELQAREVLARMPSLTELLARCRRETSPFRSLTYEGMRTSAAGSSYRLTFFVRPDDPTAISLLNSLDVESANAGEVSVQRHTQDFQRSANDKTEILRVEVAGPHDLLRYAADDFDALWA